MSDRLTIRIDSRMREIIKGLAMAERKSASQVIRDALFAYFEKLRAEG